MTDAIIEVVHLTRIYRVGDIDVKALRDVSLSIERGEFVAIMGSSGSGKSTLMSILGCLDQPTSGQYLFEGFDVAHYSESELARIRSQRIGFVFQSFNLLARTSAIENVALPLFYSDVAPSTHRERIARARNALAVLKLGDREENTPGQLSGGQQQRVAIARALINDPAVILADEPTGNLDTQTSYEIMDTLKSLNRDRGVTVVMVTHEPDIAKYADRTVTMRDGQIVADERRASLPIARNRRRSSPPMPEAAPVALPAVIGFARMVSAAAVQALARNVTRSVLTMLGVFIGVAALIAMIAVGQGANDAVRKQIESLGTNLFVVVPGASALGGARAGFGSASTLTKSDAEDIRREASAVGSVSYLIRQSGQIQYMNRNWTTTIQGVSSNYPPVTNWRIAEGRGIAAEDERSTALVAVIGQSAFRQLFPDGLSPVGATIQVRSTPLRIIGLLAPKGQTAYGQDQDDVIMVPFATAERKILGVAAPTQNQTPLNWVYPPYPNPYNLQPRLTGFVNQIYVQANDAGGVSEAVSQVDRVLTRRHNIRPRQPRDFSIRNLSQIAETAEGSSRTMSILLAAVASISLLVGGIGIMNILLVSVTERTREIGLRMAIGARRLHVLLQFLAEAVFLSVTGGMAGIVTGICFSLILPMLTGWQAPISTSAVLGGFAFAAAVGIFFGYYPAQKAAHLNPIDALRYE
ncbi:ABC transporter permease [Bradyrhizobium sp. STM 3809]|uniref:ABC transporter permease n=1 Tax=Bradyrhizobium sp. STM 3809 TaxID=551936 RepID=UPI00024081D1|nr:ABC transporter permease [Bradyrhizobium sp. STM 3809]CCE03050.1 Macrolide export ATP-binding/permease protein macB [Bradyrhizobium sp. STM 3809]